MKNKTSYQIYFLLSVVGVFGIFLAFSGTKKESIFTRPQTHEVVLTDLGFEPSRLEIYEGDTVIFKTSLNKSFQPASDPHPLHTAYENFDPGRELGAHEAWSFLFKEDGVWAYHDHVGVSQGGVIVVKKGGGSYSKNNMSFCDKSVSESPACFDEELRKTVRESGVEAAFKLLAEKYDTGKVPAACHWSAHKIGDEAYLEEERGRPLILTSDTYYCGYGFFHGYLEIMLRKNPYPAEQKEKVVAFCDKAQQQLEGEARDNCYHGIGSGFTENPPQKSVWGKPAELVKPGLEICEKLFGTTREWEMCTTGVFAVLANFLSDRDYDFAFDIDDPFKFCRDLPKDLHRACYGEFAAKLSFITNNNLKLVPNYLKNVETSIAKLMVGVAAVTVMQDAVMKDDQSNFIYDCRLFSRELQPSCIDGIVWGFLYHGRINEEHVKAVNFCNSKLFDSKERDFCYQRLIARAKNMYSINKFDKMCSVLRSEYQHYCKKDLPVQIYDQI